MFISAYLVYQPILGGDDHDIGNYGTFLEFKKKHNKVYEDKAGSSQSIITFVFYNAVCILLIL